MPDTHKIIYGGRTLPVPDGVNLEQAKQLMARHFPELADPEVASKKDGDVTIWTFSKKAGRKGAGRHSALIARLAAVRRRRLLTTAGVVAIVVKVARGNLRARRKLYHSMPNGIARPHLRQGERVVNVANALEAAPALPTTGSTLL